MGSTSNDPSGPDVPESDVASEPRTSTEWQRIASRRAFQKDLPGAIAAMEEAVAVDPNSFHHWMWMGHLCRQMDDDAGSRRCAREGLRCLHEHPDPTISLEERTRLIVRTNLHAGNPGDAREALDRLEEQRETALKACLHAESFLDWYQADIFAAPIYETILELRRLLGDPEELSRFTARYRTSLERGIALAEEDGASDEDLAVLHRRLEISAT